MSENITDEELLSKIDKLYNKIMSLKDDDDYIINKEQMLRLIEIINFFTDVTQKCDGKIEPVELIPREEVGGVTASFVVFDIYSDEVQRFCDVMRNVSAITIDSTENGEICISITVPNVFTLKN